MLGFKAAIKAESGLWNQTAARTERPNRRVVSAVALLIICGSILRAWQYSSDASLWLDEIALAKGIIETDLWSLLSSPLPYNQVSPKGFVLVEKLTVMLIGKSDFSLRLFPFICSLISLAVFGVLSVRLLEPAGAIGATLLFATAAPLVAFGAIVKQYSTDVCIAVLLWWIAFEATSRAMTASRAVLTGTAGFLLVWFSQPAVLMIAGLGISVVLVNQWVGTRWKYVILVGLCWGAGAMAATALAIVSMSDATREYVQAFWFQGFPPDSFAAQLRIGWPLNRVYYLFASGSGLQAAMNYPLPALYAFLSIAGFAVALLRNWKSGLLLSAPVIVTIGAAVARLYPFTDRLIVFLLPAFLLALGVTIEWLYRTASRMSTLLASVIVVLMLIPGIYPIVDEPPPYRLEDIKPALRHIRSRWQSGDSLYVYYGAAPAMSFYAEGFGFSRSDYVIGGCHRTVGRRYLAEVDSMRGRGRVWILITHSLPYYRESEDIIGYLDEIGTRNDELTIESYAVGRTPRPVQLYLYDLSDPEKLSRTNSASYPLSGPDVITPGFGCDAAAQTMVPPDF